MALRKSNVPNHENACLMFFGHMVSSLKLPFGAPVAIQQPNKGPCTWVTLGSCTTPKYPRDYLNACLCSFGGYGQKGLISMFRGLLEEKNNFAPNHAAHVFSALPATLNPKPQTLNPKP